MSADASGYPTQAPQNATSAQESAEADRMEARLCKDILEAFRCGNVRAVQHFLRVDPASVKARDDLFGLEQPLHKAARNGHVAVVEVLLDAGASVDAKDDTFGSTPLHWAAQKGPDAVVERLLAAGASVDAVDNDGETPLHRAAQFGRDAVVERLLAAGANIDATDNEGQTPLHRAAQFGSHTTVERLLDAGATADAVDICGMTPYQLADRQGRANVLGLFNPVWVVLGLGGNTKIRCNSHESRTVSDLKEDAEKKLGVQNIQLCPVGSFEPLTINDTPLHTKNIQPGDTIMAVVVVPPSDQQDSETDD